MGLAFASPTTNQENLAVTNRQDITANDQAVVWAPRNSNNFRGGKNNSYGLNEQQVAAMLGTLGTSLHAGIAGIGTRDSGGPESIDDALRARIIDNIETGKPSVVNSLGTSNWLLIGAGAVALLAVVLLRRKKS